ncbi:MAG: class I SAM-dependent methyltransferase [Gemmataceae bacterium]|nr:class I SAM-dependent methyltransferase [Gemmataceae bacterium]
MLLSAPPLADALVWEETSCPLCGAEDEELLLEVPSPAGSPPYRVVGCRGCGLGYLNPRPDERTIDLLYPADYTWYHPPGERGSAWARLKERLRRLVMARHFGTPEPPTNWVQKALARVASWWLRPSRQSMTALPYHGQGRLLDYGCGSGWYARQMRDLGWQVTAMDFNPHAAEQVSRHFGIPTLAGTLPHPQVSPGSFDAITLGAVLEHVHRPHALIAAAAEALAPGGYLVVSVPNLASWGFRYFGEHWWGLQLPHHLLHFTPQTLRGLLETHGLEVREVKEIGRPGWMQRSLAAARANESARRRLLVKLGKWRLTASVLARWTQWKGQTDCIEAIAYRRPALPLAA